MTGITGISGMSGVSGATDEAHNQSRADYPEGMRQIQHAFIDDPRKAAHDADRLACELVQACADELTRRRGELEAGPGGGEAPDTERLRQSVRRYRDFVDALARTVDNPGDDERSTALTLPEETTYRVGEDGEAEAVDRPGRDVDQESPDDAPQAELPLGAEVTEQMERPGGL